MVGRRNLTAVAALVAVFCLGGIAGGLAAHAWSEARYADELMLGPGLRHEQRMLQGLARRLDLTDEQRSKIQALAAEHGKTHRELMGALDVACFSQIEAEKDRFDSAIRALLTSDQQRHFDELLAQQGMRFGRRGPRGGRGGRHGAQGR